MVRSRFGSAMEARSSLLAAARKNEVCLHSDREFFDRSIGRTLRQHRRARRLSLRQIASSLGVSFQQISKYETGQSSLTLWTALQICQVLDLTLADIVPRRLPRARLRLHIPPNTSSDWRNMSAGGQAPESAPQETLTTNQLMRMDRLCRVPES